MSTTDENNTRAESNGNGSGVKPNMHSDIHDSPQDEAKMASKSFTIDLPDVSDIPGQEHIVVPEIGEMADTTISSDDEEGAGLFGDDDNDESTELVMGTDADISKTEKSLLVKASHDMNEDDLQLQKAGLDSTDNDGVQLNEGGLSTNVSGSDLDIPIAEVDDAMEDIGEEDEENNIYSLGSDSNDNVTEGTP